MACDLELEVVGDSGGSYRVRVIKAVAGGEPWTNLDLDIDNVLDRRAELEMTVLASAVTSRRLVSDIERPVQEVGQRLFEALFSGPVYGTYRACLGIAHERQERLRVVLRLAAPELALLPWETLFDPETESYLCRHEPLVRHIPAPYNPDPLQFAYPLRVLVIIASPRNLPVLDTDAERRQLEEALAEQVRAGRVELHWLLQARWDSLHDQLLAGTWHVLHFIGHGAFDQHGGEGSLALVSENGGPDMVEASRMADLLREAQPTPRLILLNCCSSGQGGSSDLFASTGAALVRRGISAAAAMQFSVSDQAAIRFARAFYAALARGRPIDQAVQSGRIGILGAAGTLEWVTPVLYLRGENPQLFTLTEPPPADSHRTQIGSLDTAYEMARSAEDAQVDSHDGVDAGKEDNASLERRAEPARQQRKRTRDEPVSATKYVTPAGSSSQSNRHLLSPRRKPFWLLTGALILLALVAGIGVPRLNRRTAWAGDSLRGSVIDLHRWSVSASPGVTEDEHDGLTVSLPPNPPGGAQGTEVGRLTARCSVAGDFDVQLSYVVEWPSGSLGRLGIFAGGVSSQRINQARGYDDYAVNINTQPSGLSPPGSVLAPIPTTDLTGQLRLVRVGRTYTGYARGGSDQSWIPLGHTTKATAMPVVPSIAVWGDHPDGNRSAVLTDFHINKGSCSR